MSRQLRLTVSSIVSRQPNPKLVGVVSVFLRGLLLGGKFLFMLALAQQTTTSTVGKYGLVVTVVTMFVYLIGAELHAYTTREVVNPDKGVQRELHIQSHGWFVITGCLLSLPLIWLVLEWINIRKDLSMTLLALVLFGEVLCQELARYLLIFGHSIKSNLLQLLRSAAWMPFAARLIDNGSPATLDIVLISWAGGCFLAVLFGLWHIRSFFHTCHKLTWSWVCTAFRSSRFYFAVALLTQVQVYADRFIIQLYQGESQVGLLAFYQSFANTIQTFVQTGVIAILLPKLILATQRHEWQSATRIGQHMLFASMGFAIVISLLLLAGMPLVLKFIGHPEYESLLDICPWLLLGNLLVVAGLIPHLRLYAMRRDSLLMHIFLFVAPISVVANLLMVPRFGVQGAVMVFVCVAAMQTAIKFYYAIIAASQVSTPIERVHAS